jgi:hypothetical protein
MTRSAIAKTFLAGICGCALASHAEPWKFGIMGDTQWEADLEAENPNSVAVGIINQVNKEMIQHGAKFVVAVGDVTDMGGSSQDTAVPCEDTRATYAQELYNAGLGFFPLRGNHDDSKWAAAEFLRVFPQTVNGVQNNTPSNGFNWTDSANIHTVVRGTTSTFPVGTNFSSPANLSGLSYTFQYGNATFVLLDQFTNPDSVTILVDTQQTWIDSILSHRPAGTHAFIFSHKGLIMSNHKDNLFGNDVDSDAVGVNTFLKSLKTNNARFLFNGHDHMHEYSLVTTTDSVTANIHELTTASCSYKFYTPGKPYNDSTDVTHYHVHRQVPVSQRLYDVGYYIVTVDGANVSIDYYAVPSGSITTITTTPELTGNWTWKERLGNSLNGKEFVVPQGGSYTAVADTFQGTIARILDGVNTATDTDYVGRHFRQLVNTGWSSADSLQSQSSRILTLWGLNPTLGTDTTAPFVLSLSYDSLTTNRDSAKTGLIQLLARDTAGNWSLAAAHNKRGTPTFVARAWKSGDTLGTYGVDTTTHQVWAVLDRAADFAVAALPSGTAGLRTGLVKAAIPVRLDGRTLTASIDAMVQLKDLQGRTVFSKKMSKGQSVTLACPSGMYVLRAQGLESRIQLVR